MRRKIPTRFTVELDQLERLSKISIRTRLNRSLIIRDALERELERYELADPTRKVDVYENGTA